MIRLIFVFLFISASMPAFSYEKLWGSGNDVFMFSFLVNQNGDNLDLLSEGRYNNNVEFKIHDYVHKCETDAEISLIDSSVEYKNINKLSTLLFAYKIGCVGGIEPYNIKYFAFQDGKKYALRGEEMIMTPEGVFGGENGPSPSVNLKRKKELMDYMLSKWRIFSLRKYKE
ncbi:M949_RS01915 family surface polysaccharide biosynthesis protein [Aeromonas schubertii]|uniref:M949_RS01915 family surface polysaccharide biosynthesis protein n=1 Tax=Aeromonas schubertii TaxID=652 RepID=UPI001CC76C4E|nr:hypothetical protein [Aeromonas schubertii]MBZ6072439.1 hypothetical protein [Aeromonas schubertii]